MKKLLVIVDMQNDFIDGALGTKEAQAIVPKVTNKVREYLDKGHYVTFTLDTHMEDYLTTQEGRNLPVKHCIKGTNGWKICDALLEFTNEANTYVKNTFGSITLADAMVKLLKEEQIEEIELCGLCTDICVISNALLIKAQLPEVKITVDASCCAGVTPQSHNNALEAMKMCQINIIN